MTLSDRCPGDFEHRTSTPVNNRKAGILRPFIAFQVAGLSSSALFHRNEAWRWVARPPFARAGASAGTGFLRSCDAPDLRQRLGFLCIGLVGYAMRRSDRSEWDTFRFFVPLLLILNLSCSEPADIEHPKSYTGAGVSFRYPGNWTFAASVSENGESRIRVESPQGSRVIVSISAGNDSTHLDEMFTRHAEELYDTIKKSGGAVTQESTVPVSTDSDGSLRMGMKRRIVAQMNGQQNLYHQTVYQFRNEKSQCHITYQSEDAYILDTVRGFELVLASFQKKQAIGNKQ